MNALFWLAVALLIVTALAIIVVPLWRRNELAASDVRQRNISIARERLRELKQQLQDGALDQHQFDEQYRELELALSDDLDAVRSVSERAGQGKWLIPVIIVMVPLVSLAMYAALGDPDAVVKIAQQREAEQKQQKARETIFKMVDSLAERLQREPDDFEGWLMLGRSYKYMQRFQEAAQAFSQAYRLRGDDPAVMLQYADALAMAQDGRLSGKPAELVFKALELSPDDVTALWLGGMAKAESGEYQEALAYWQRLEPMLADNPESLKEVRGLIAALQDQIAETADTPKGAPSVMLDVRVVLDPSLKDEVQPNDTVFVYAQAPSGPKMPLAIVRKQAADLPLTVELSDKMAMTPAMKLSAFETVRVIARISKSGNAVQQTGDLIGVAEAAKPGQGDAVAVTIDQRVK